MIRLYFCSRDILAVHLTSPANMLQPMLSATHLAFPVSMGHTT